MPLSACVNGVKMRVKVAASMPMPLSATLSVSIEAAASAPSTARTKTRPCRPGLLLNLMALPIRLIRIWRKRAASPSAHCGSAGSVNRRSATPLPADSESSVSHTASTTAATSIGSLSIWNCPASIFEKSSTSSTMVSSA